MKKNETTTFPESCISCDRKSPEGNALGGIITTVNLDGEIIFATQCWHCAFEEARKS